MWNTRIGSHTRRQKQYLNFWKISMNSSSCGGLAFSASKLSGVKKTKQNKTVMMSQHNMTPQRDYSISFYLQRFVFCFSSSSSSSSGSAPLQHLQFAAVCPWSSQCRQSSDWGWPEEKQSSFIWLLLSKKKGAKKWPKRARTTSLSARRKSTSGPLCNPFADLKRSSAILIQLVPRFGFSFLFFIYFLTLHSTHTPSLTCTRAQSPLCAPEKDILVSYLWVRGKVEGWPEGGLEHVGRVGWVSRTVWASPLRSERTCRRSRGVSSRLSWSKVKTALWFTVALFTQPSPPEGPFFSPSVSPRHSFKTPTFKFNLNLWKVLMSRKFRRLMCSDSDSNSSFVQTQMHRLTEKSSSHELLTKIVSWNTWEATQGAVSGTHQPTHPSIHTPVCLTRWSCPSRVL